MTELTPLIPAPSITKLLPTITDKQVKWMIIKALLSRFRCKIFARCCGYPACAPPAGVCPKFCSFADAVARVADGETLSFVGIAGNLQVVGFWFALVRRFRREGHPRNLTVVCHGGNGGRGKMPGSMDDFADLYRAMSPMSPSTPSARICTSSPRSGCSTRPTASRSSSCRSARCR